MRAATRLARVPLRQVHHAPPRTHEQWPLEMPLLRFTPRDVWTLRDACEGVAVFGGTGAGKSSGSGQHLANAYLRAGFGGIVLCAKPDERERWEKYCAETGRTGSLIVFNEASGHRFNFLNYELNRGEQSTHNVVQLLLKMVEASNGQAAAKQGDAFWDKAVAELLSHVIDALWGAYGTVSLDDILTFVISAPQNLDEARTQKWKDTSFCCATIAAMYDARNVRLPEHDAQVVAQFILRRWPRLNDRTRTSIESHLTAMITPFTKGYLRDLFGTQTTLVPELTHHGAIIVIDLPVKTHSDAGILGQHIIKYLWQRAAERRADTQANTTRPVFCWGDEAQFFVSEYDNEFMSTARSARASTVYMTQNLPTYYSRMGGAHPQHTADAMLGNLATKIFHQNSDVTTNEWAANVIGKEIHWLRNRGISGGYSESESVSVGRSSGTSYSSGTSQSAQGTSYSTSGGSTDSHSLSFSDSQSTNRGFSTGASEQLHHTVLPTVFSQLQQADGRHRPEAIVMKGGRVWSQTGGPWLKCRF